MKKQLTPYFYSFGFLLISYLIIAFLLVLFSYLFNINNTIYKSTILITSYTIIMITSFLFIHLVNSKPIIHVSIFALIYLIISYLSNNGVNNLLHLFLKPLIFIICCIIFTMLKPDKS